MRWGRILLHYYFLEGGMERRILFVEDDANFRKVFTRLMREALPPNDSPSRSLRQAP